MRGAIPLEISYVLQSHHDPGPPAWTVHSVGVRLCEKAVQLCKGQHELPLQPT